MSFSLTTPAVFLSLAALAGPSLGISESFPQATGEGRTLFQAQCAACHSAGTDRLIGPGLQGVTERREREWLVAYITSPDRMIAEGDPVAVGLLEEYQVPMPNLGLTAAQAEAILDYLAGIEATTTATSTSRTQLAEGDAAVGRELFTGGRSLEEDGAACISCHNVAGLGPLGGGTLAKDLTAAAALYGDGLPALLETPPYPAMQAVYANRPLTTEEVENLSAFLIEVEQSEALVQFRFPFPAAGIGGTAVLIALAGLLWRRRLRGVRKPLIGEHA